MAFIVTILRLTRNDLMSQGTIRFQNFTAVTAFALIDIHSVNTIDRRSDLLRVRNHLSELASVKRRAPNVVDEGREARGMRWRD